MNRPMVLVASAFILGMISALAGWLPGPILPAALAVLGCLLLWAGKARPTWATPAMALLFIGAGALHWNARHAGETGDALVRYALAHSEDLIYTLEGRVENPDILLDSGNYLQFTLRTDAVTQGDEAIPVEGGVLVRWQDARAPVFHGDRVRVSGPLDATLGRVNHGFRGVEGYRRNQDVHTLLRVYGDDAVQQIESGNPFNPTHQASRFRHALATRLEKAVPEETLPFMLTVWLGDRRRIQADTYADFLESGTAHILAVSGLHMGIVFVSVNYLLRLLIHRPRLRNLIVMSVIFFFAFLAGARISSLRAAIMIALYLTADLLDREPDAPTALSLSALLFTIHDPNILLDPGFQLSFSSIASLLLFRSPFYDQITRIPGVLREGLSATLAVQILPFPLAATLFHVFPFIGVLLNLFIIPLLGVILWLSFLTSAFAFLLPPVAPLFGHAAAPFVNFVMVVTGGASSLSRGHAYLTSPTLWAVAAYLLAAMLGWYLLTRTRHRRRTLWSMCALLVAVPLLWNPWFTRAHITFLDVGHGDAAVVRTPSGHTVLIDSGDSNEFIDTGRRVIAPYLWSNYISRLDAIILSHPDQDHMGGTPYVLEHFPVKALYLGAAPFETELEKRILSLCKERGVAVHRLKRGDSISFGDTTLTTLHPPGDFLDASDNDRSLVLRLAWPGMSTLFTGDIEALGESSVLNGLEPIPVVKVPHHGSATSSSEAFVQATQPQFAVVSVGRRGRRTVVRREVLDRWKNAGAEIFRTDWLGSIRIESVDGELKTTNARENKGFPVRK